MYTIAIVDDHLLIAKALGGIIEQFSQYKLLYELDSGHALIEKCKNKKNIPDIILLDVSMPLMNGFEVATWLRENHPQVLIMALSMQDDEQTIIKMIKAGARGYLHKNVHPADLEKALGQLVKNGHYYPEWAANKLINNIINDKPVNETKLNERETLFLQYCCTEMTYKEIAEKMFCSPRTVEGYRDILFEKLHLKSRVGLALYAVKNGIAKTY